MADREIKKKVIEEIAGYASGERAKALKAKYKPAANEFDPEAPQPNHPPVEEDVDALLDRSGDMEEVRLKDGSYASRPIPALTRARAAEAQAKEAAIKAPFKDRFDEGVRKARGAGGEAMPELKQYEAPAAPEADSEGLMAKLQSLLGTSEAPAASSADSGALSEEELEAKIRELEETKAALEAMRRR